MTSPWVGMAIVLVALCGLLCGLMVAQKKFNLHPEIVRKILHIGMGSVTISFPWLFNQNWPAISLAVISISLLLGVKALKAGEDGLHDVVHGVRRNSLGEIYFPLSVCLIFVLSQGDPLLYTIPILVLTLADAVAALVGLKYGSLLYQTSEGTKSVEGSLAFFVTAFLSVQIPLLLFTDTGRIETILIASIIAMLAMLLEALAWKGLDNLFIPLGGYLLLNTYLDLSVIELYTRLIVCIALNLFVIVWRKRATLIENALLAGAFIGYVAWSTGDWTWFLPIGLLFITYTTYSSTSTTIIDSKHDVRSVLAVTLPGMLWLFFALSEEWLILYFTFTLSFAIQLSMIKCARLNFYKIFRTPFHRGVYATLLSSAIILIPWLIIKGISTATIMYLCFGVFIVSIATLTFYRLQPHIHDCPTDNSRWWRQGLIGLVFSATSLPINYFYPI